MVPDDGLEAFRTQPPVHSFLTDRHHHRGSARFRRAFGTQAWVHLVPLGDDAALAIGDALRREGDRLDLMPDWLLGDEPAAVKRALTESLRALLRHEFTHPLLGHGAPWIGGGRDALRRFVGA